jgi:hypothetical protein
METQDKEPATALARPIASVDPWKLAQQLARPLARGYLALANADATLLCHTVRVHRERWLASDSLDLARSLQHILRINLRSLQLQRTLATYHVQCAIKPLIVVMTPPPEVFGAAYGMNEDQGSPLSDVEVKRITKMAALRFFERRSVCG